MTEEPVKPDICVCAGNVELKHLFKEIDYAYGVGAKYLEVRFDLIEETAEEAFSAHRLIALERVISGINSYAKGKGIGLIGTKRPKDYMKNRLMPQKEDAGKTEYDPGRLIFLKSLTGIGMDLVDLELDAVSPHYVFDFVRFAHSNNSRVILSAHNFSGIIDLEETIMYYMDCAYFGGDFLKIADTVKSKDDALITISKNLKLKKIRQADHASFPEYIVFSMGEEGKTTRMLSLKAGSSFAYCSSPSCATAPGQYNAPEFYEKFRMLSLADL